MKWLCVVVLTACGGDAPKAPESELRTLLYCNQDWGNSPHRINNAGNPRCETPCASFSLLVRHAPPAVADAFCAARLAGDAGLHYGTLPPGVDAGTIVARHTPPA